MTVTDTIEREVLINAPVAKVWAAVTTAEHIGTWFGNAGATIDLRPGGAMTCSWRDGATVDTIDAVVEKVDEPHLFAFRWARPNDKVAGPSNATLVEFTLSAEGAGTRLRVVESGFAELDKTEELVAAHVAENTEGWLSELEELRTYAPTIA
jgi:uncharacterized protein YndB with AHSA1/START domain